MFCRCQFGVKKFNLPGKFIMNHWRRNGLGMVRASHTRKFCTPGFDFGLKTDYISTKNFSTGHAAQHGISCRPFYRNLYAVLSPAKKIRCSLPSSPCCVYSTCRTYATSTCLESNMSNDKPSDSSINQSKSHFYRSSVVVKVKDLEEHLRYKGYSTLRWGLLILFSAGFGLYMFREPIKENISDEVADVASRSLGDQNVVLRANEVSKAIVNEIMNDPNTLELAADFVVKLLQKDDVLNKSMEFLISVINAPETRKHVIQLTADTFANLLETESTRRQLLDYIQSVVLETQTVESCKELLSVVATDPQSKQILAEFFKNVLSSKTVTDQAVNLGKNVSCEVVNDKKLQEESVDALWQIFKLSLTPGWFASTEINTKASLKPGK